MGDEPVNAANIPAAAVHASVTAVAVTKREPDGASMERAAKPPGPIAAPGGTSMRTPFGVSVAR